jgi:hypothetical protein
MKIKQAIINSEVTAIILPVRSTDPVRKLKAPVMKKEIGG